MADFLGKSLFAMAGFTLLLGFFTEIAAQVAMDSNQFDYTQNCPAFDKCSFSRLNNDTDHVRLDEVRQYWARDIAVVLVTSALVVGSMFTRMYVTSKKKDDRWRMDLAAYLIGTTSMLTGLYFIFNTFIRSLHLHAWIDGVSNNTIDFSDTYKTDEFTDENFTKIMAYRVTNDTSTTGEVKSAYWSVIVAVIVFLFSNLFESLGCMLKKQMEVNSKQKETGWKKHLKKVDDYMGWWMHVVAFILAIIVVSRIGDLETSELEMRMEKGGTTEFTTKSLYYTVWVTDVSNVSTPKYKHPHVAGLTSTGERLESTETQYDSDIYGISNVCRSKEDSMVTPSTVQWVIGVVLVAKGIALMMQFIAEILDMTSSPGKKDTTLATVLRWEESIRSFLDFGVSVAFLSISLIVMYNSMSTQCHRNPLMNNSEADYALRIFCALIAVVLTINYQAIQSLDSTKGLQTKIEDRTKILGEVRKDTDSAKSSNRR